ncbi:hypothetical protein NU08_1969 [Flavobacterium anhuiense]|uniref:Uncharacterized protein n=1 Tax=Flavobacterium anhuiense TaxID=459526 RepID=A0A444VZS3_9FLAO|nr:hypothetical protein NU08_1969 [Flavobacterium anhuiense]
MFSFDEANFLKIKQQYRYSFCKLQHNSFYFDNEKFQLLISSIC